MTSLLRRHPWIPLAALFLSLVAAWVAWLSLASRHAPESVPLEPPHNDVSAR